MRQDQLMSASGKRMRIREIPEMLAATASRAPRAGGSFANVAKAANAAVNQAAAFGEALIKHKKPIGLGFAGMLAMGAVLSSPSETIGQGAGLVPNGSIIRGKLGLDCNLKTYIHQDMPKATLHLLIC